MLFFRPVAKHFAALSKAANKAHAAFGQGLSYVWIGFELRSDKVQSTFAEGLSTVPTTLRAYAKHLTGIRKTPCGPTQNTLRAYAKRIAKKKSQHSCSIVVAGFLETMLQDNILKISILCQIVAYIAQFFMVCLYIEMNFWPCKQSPNKLLYLDNHLLYCSWHQWYTLLVIN